MSFFTSRCDLPQKEHCRFPPLSRLAATRTSHPPVTMLAARPSARLICGGRCPDRGSLDPATRGFLASPRMPAPGHDLKHRVGALLDVADAARNVLVCPPDNPDPDSLASGFA